MREDLAVKDARPPWLRGDRHRWSPCAAEGCETWTTAEYCTTHQEDPDDR